MEMKKRNFIKTGIGLGMALCATAFLATGCGSDNEAAMPENAGRVALQVNSGIDVQSRAHDDTWEADDAIGIYMLKDDGSIEAANSKYTTGAGGTDEAFAPAADDQTIYFPVNGDPRDFIAYYPYRTLGGDHIYPVDVTTQAPQKDIDLMGAGKVTGKDKNHPAVAFTFTHKLVKLALSIRPDGTSLTAGDLDGLTVTLTNQQTRATYNVVTGESVTIGEGEPATITLLTAADGTSAEGIVLPNSDTKDMLFEFKLKNGIDTFRWAIKEAEKSERFAAGSKYLYTLTLGRTGIEVISTVTDWMPGNGGGEAGNAQ